MTITKDRASGAFFLVFGFLLYAYVAPTYIETVDSGWVYPSTIPNAVAIILILSGTPLIFKPTQHSARPLGEMVKAAVFFVLLCAGIRLIPRIGFMFAAPGIALVLMLLMGERRPFWLLMGCITTPAFIWLLVALLLDCSLP